MQNSNALVLEVLKENNALAMSVFEQKELASTLRYYGRLAISFPEIDKLCQELTSILSKPDKQGAFVSDSVHNLKKVGQLLWGHLLTKAVKDRLKASQNKDLILSLDEELIDIPWELLYTGEDFLCLKFNLGRVVRTKENINAPQYRYLSAKPRMLILANPTSDLKSAYAEGIHIRNQFDKKRKEINIDLKSTHIDTLYVKKALQDYDIVHFAGHCEYDAASPKNSGWVLKDGRFTAGDIHKLGETLSLPDLIFSNSCYSAGSRANLMDLDYQRKTYSLASAFLFSGVRHYIGTIRKVEDSISLSFAREFYSQLIAGKSVGESLRLGRLKLIKEYGVTAIPWTSYLLYGDPNFVLFKAKLKPVKERLKKGALFYKKVFLWSSLTIFIVSICIYLYIWLPSINPSTYVLFSKSHKLYSTGNNQEVILLCSRIIQKDKLFLAVYPLLADTYERLGKRDEALRCYFDYALACEKKEDKNNLAGAYIGIGWIYYLKGEYSRSFEFYQKAINLSRTNQDKLHEAEGLRKLALWYNDRGNCDQALELLMKSSEINRERQNIYAHRYNLACDYFDIGLVFTDKDDLYTAKEFYAKSRQLFGKLKLKEELSDYYFNLGEIYLFEKEHQKALDCYMKGLKIDQLHGNKPSIASDYNMVGELYMAMDNLAEAEKYFNQSVSASLEIDAQPELAYAYYNLGLLYKERGQRNKMREYLRLAQEIYWRIDTPEYQRIKQEFAGIK